jgi:hypothetical protein
MASKADLKWLSTTGTDRDLSKSSIPQALDKKIDKFLKQVQKNARKYKLIGTGNLVSEKGYRVETIQDNANTIIQIFMVNYGMYQNRGVRGLRSFSNAPDSPYSFKKWGMSKEGLKSIADGIRRGKYITKNVKYKRVGLERKATESKDPIEQQAKQIAYNIKKYGIKTKPFFTEAFQSAFGKFDTIEIDAIKKDLVATLIKSNK